LTFDAPDAPFVPDGVCDAPPIFVRHTRARRYVLRLLPDGRARVTIPRGGSKTEAQRFADSQRDWIARQRRILSDRRARRPPLVWTPDGSGRDTILLRGRPTRLTRADGPPAVIEVEPGRLLVSAPGRNVGPLVIGWLKARAREELPARLRALGAQRGLEVTAVSIRNQRTRWGSCAPGGRISLNWRLIQVPDEVRDYVLLHELMHIRHPNHSPRFWKAVANACPWFDSSRAWLRQHSDLVDD
jgi:predicted metal-dependent hydrolase